MHVAAYFFFFDQGNYQLYGLHLRKKAQVKLFT